MLQGLHSMIAGVMANAVNTGLFVSLCTIQEPVTTFNADGTPTGAYTTVTGLVNIQAMKAPQPFGEGSVAASEVKSIEEILSLRPFHLLLASYYPQIISSWRAVIDGVAHDILGAESDSQGQMTRLLVRLASI